MGRIRTYWCEECQEWTNIDPSPLYRGTPNCRECGEVYKCGECGYEVDNNGICQRPDDLNPEGAVCPETGMVD